MELAIYQLIGNKEIPAILSGSNVDCTSHRKLLRFKVTNTSLQNVFVRQKLSKDRLDGSWFAFFSFPTAEMVFFLCKVDKHEDD